MKHKKIKIFCPIFQQFEFLLYCSNVFDYDEVIFENSINKKSIFFKKNIIDIKLIKEFNKINFSKKNNYKIFFWNGEKHYYEHFEIIKDLKAKLKKNLSIFFVGNATKILNAELATKIKKKKVLFKNISFRHRIAFYYPHLFSILAIYKDFIKFIKLFKKKMICFTGLVKINYKFIKHLKNDWNFSNSSILILKKLERYFYKKKYPMIGACKSYLNSKQYSKLPLYEKYFMSQIIFRNLLFKNLLKNNFFYLQDWDDRTKIMDSVFYKQFLFLDLGSTAGSDEIYARSLILKHFKKKYLTINFFDNKKKKDFNNSNKKMLRYIEYITSLKALNSYDFNQLKIELERFKNFV